MNAEEISQWVIDIRYPKSPMEKVSDSELFSILTDKINQYVLSKKSEWCKKQREICAEKVTYSVIVDEETFESHNEIDYDSIRNAPEPKGDAE